MTALIAVLLLTAGAITHAESPIEPLVLRAGESRVVTVAEVARVAVGQPSIADVRVLSPTEVLINGKGEGQTTLLLWPPTGRVVERVVRVLGPSPVLTATDVTGLLADEHVRVREVSGYLVVDGQPTQEGRARLSRVAGLLGSRLLDLTSPEVDEGQSAPNSRPGEEDLDAVNSVLSRLGGGEAKVERRAGKIVVAGRVPGETAHRDVVAFAGAFFPGQVVDALTVAEAARLFSVKARVIEVDRQASQELGLEWPDGIAVGESAAPSGLAVEALSRLEPLLLKLRTLEQDGRARILAQPAMMVMDGSEGLFLAGGQIPVPLEIDGRTTVEWKEYGVRLRVQPKLLPTGRIRLVARPEVSTLDWANGVKLNGGTVPALRSRFAETAVEQASGDTLVLAGLSLAEESDHTGRVPGAFEIPLLGALFKSTRGAQRQTELTILLTTTLLPAAEPAVAGPEGEAQHGAV